jgi:hypothetical protein
MGLLGRREDRPTVRGRARVVPTTAANVGDGVDGNMNNLTAKSAAKSSVRLEATVAEDGGPVAPGSQRVTVRLPNWLRHVLYDAGSNEGEWADLPAELDVPVLLDANDRTIVAMDVDAAAAELEPYRAVGTRAFKKHDAILAPVRSAMRLPGTAVREGKDFVSTWRKVIRNRGGGDDGPLDPAELEQRRRTAVILRATLERKPKEREKIRSGVLENGPSMAASVRAGGYPPHDFDAWVMFQETSGVISAEEAAGFRAAAAPDPGAQA